MGLSPSKEAYATNDYELVIKSAKELEDLLEEQFGATGKGLHEKITTAQDLSPSLQKRLRYLATIRNKLVHDVRFDRIPDRQSFIEAFERAQAELQSLLEARRRQQAPAEQTSGCVMM
jgi:flagellar biosynthesis chaperone FliJ